jgi:hypothetical protein
MPSTFAALAVVLVALLPGGLYLWAVERLVGRWGIGVSDRLLRFIGVSAFLHALAAPATYAIWHDYLRTDAVPEGRSLPLWLWPVLAAYVVGPTLLGTGVGLAMRRWELPELLVGATRPPTAWDDLFSKHKEGYIRMKLKSGPFVGGALAAGSCIGGYPEPADIYIADAIETDPHTGEFAKTAAGDPVFTGYGFLVRWGEVEYLDFAPR